MKRLPSFLPLLLALSACATPGNAPEPSSGPVDWPEGHFRLQGTVSYDGGAGLSGGTSTEVHWLDLTIGPDDSMLVESSAGLCLNPPEPEVRRAIARGRRSISCGKVRFTVEPAGSTLRGEMAVSYTRYVRKRGSCISYNEQGVCVDFNYDIEERPASARGSLRVQSSG